LRRQKKKKKEKTKWSKIEKKKREKRKKSQVAAVELGIKIYIIFMPLKNLLYESWCLFNIYTPENFPTICNPISGTSFVP